MLTESETYWLLTDLCNQLGFCLPADECHELEKNSPVDVRSFTDAVFVAEGLDLETVDMRLYRQVRDMVAAAFERSGADPPG